MTNPFRLRWLQGWTFQVVFMEGHVQVEAHGFGICLRTAVLPGESPQTAADRLVLAEDRRRRALHSASLEATSGSGPETSGSPGCGLDTPDDERGEALASAALGWIGIRPGLVAEGWLIEILDSTLRNSVEPPPGRQAAPTQCL